MQGVCRVYGHTITVFNYHEQTKAWYTSVFTGVSLYASDSRNATRDSGKVNASAVDVIIHVNQGREAETLIYEPNVLVDEAGNIITAEDDNALNYQEPDTQKVKKYTGPKAYAKLADPSGYFTFRPETDFFAAGNYASEVPISDDDYENGLYNAMNDAMDGVYMITSATFYSLIPHFEIGGK